MKTLLATDLPDDVADIRSGGTAAGVPTAAGRFFGPLPDGALPVAPTGVFVVHVPVGPDGFEPLGRAATPAELAAMIADCPEWEWSLVALCLTGEPTAVARAASQAPELLPTLGVPVCVSAAPVLLGDGILVTSGTFRCWALAPSAPGEPASVQHWDVGSVLSGIGPLPELVLSRSARLALGAATELPPGPDLGTDPDAVDEPAGAAGGAGAARPEPLASLDPAPAVPQPLIFTVAEGAPPGPPADPEPAPGALRDPGREPSDPATSVPPPAAIARPGTPPTPAWTPPTGPIRPGDREALRRILGWQYEVHIRAVLGLLALQPGMRSSIAGEDDVAALVAVRAVLTDPDRGVQAFLRSDRPPGADEADLTVLLRCARAGLERLPVVRAPVFAPCVEAGCEVAHQPGQLLVEPAFLEGGTAPAVSTGRTEHVIWSTTGRRVDGLMFDDNRADATTRLVFSAGSRFAVIGELTDSRGVTRVLLHEQASGRERHDDPGPSQRVVRRLRQAAERAAEASAAGAPGPGNAPPPSFARPEPSGAFR